MCTVAEVPLLWTTVDSVDGIWFWKIEKWYFPGSFKFYPENWETSQGYPLNMFDIRLTVIREYHHPHVVVHRLTVVVEQTFVLTTSNAITRAFHFCYWTRNSLKSQVLLRLRLTFLPVNYSWAHGGRHIGLVPWDYTPELPSPNDSQHHKNQP